MQFGKKIDTVEVHTGGEAFRIVTSGLPKFPGDTIVARRQWIKDHIDHIRTALIFEPRGHADMKAAITHVIWQKGNMINVHWR